MRSRRLSRALARRFDVVYGVDISPQMIKTAVQLNQYGEKCRYFVNAKENLRIFHDGTFTFIYSNIVLQHIPPILTRGYLQEFLRVLRLGGLLIFQLPGSRKRVDYSLPSEALSAGITSPLSEIVMRPGSQIAVPFRVTNLSPIPWVYDGQACTALGNHWLDDRGNLMRLDDGRAPLPVLLSPNNSVDLNLEITAPPRPGRYLLELDVVQEGVAWFRRQGLANSAASRSASAKRFWTKRRRNIRKPQRRSYRYRRPHFRMSCLKTTCIASRGLMCCSFCEAPVVILEFIQPSGCSGPGFQSYLYFVRKGDYSAASSPLRDDQV